MKICLLAFALFGCLPEDPPEQVYLPLDYKEDDPERELLPLAPHVIETHAKPTEEMVSSSSGLPLGFMILDKRTLQIYKPVVLAGGQAKAPWDGWIKPIAYVSDLVIKGAEAAHGGENHFDPAAWIILEDAAGNVLYHGWMFGRDSAQTAWDHPRFDLIFLGIEEQIE